MNDAQTTKQAALMTKKHVQIVRPLKGSQTRGNDRLTNGCKPDGQRD